MWTVGCGGADVGNHFYKESFLDLAVLGLFILSIFAYTKGVWFICETVTEPAQNRPQNAVPFGLRLYRTDFLHY